MALPARARMSEEQYLAYDLAHDGKHEFVNGEVLAMAGASEAHSLIAANLLAGLVQRLRGGPCRAHGSDLRVRIAETGLYAYPDVTVVCGEPSFAPTRPPSLLNPTLIAEVLSETTEQYDRGAKLEHYRRRSSIGTVLLVDSRERRVARYARNADGTWTLTDLVAGAVRLDPPGVDLPMDEIYEGWEQANARRPED